MRCAIILKQFAYLMSEKTLSFTGPRERSACCRVDICIGISCLWVNQLWREQFYKLREFQSCVHGDKKGSRSTTTQTLRITLLQLIARLKSLLLSGSWLIKRIQWSMTVGRTSRQYCFDSISGQHLLTPQPYVRPIFDVNPEKGEHPWHREW